MIETSRRIYGILIATTLFAYAYYPNFKVVDKTVAGSIIGGQTGIACHLYNIYPNEDPALPIWGCLEPGCLPVRWLKFYVDDTNGKNAKEAFDECYYIKNNIRTNCGKFNYATSSNCAK